MKKIFLYLIFQKSIQNSNNKKTSLLLYSSPLMKEKLDKKLKKLLNHFCLFACLGSGGKVGCLKSKSIFITYYIYIYTIYI